VDVAAQGAAAAEFRDEIDAVVEERRVRRRDVGEPPHRVVCEAAAVGRGEPVLRGIGVAVAREAGDVAARVVRHRVAAGALHLVELVALIGGSAGGETREAVGAVGARCRLDLGGLVVGEADRQVLRRIGEGERKLRQLRRAL
jgi:hypothetical protein